VDFGYLPTCPGVNDSSSSDGRNCLREMMYDLIAQFANLRSAGCASETARMSAMWALSRAKRASLESPRGERERVGWKAEGNYELAAVLEG
jgi:hypothetical protein